MIHGTGPDSAYIEVSYGEVHNLSVDFLKHIQSSNTDGAVAAVAAILTAGRILSSEVLTEDAEVAYIQAAMDWLGLYFADGTIN